MPARSAVIIVIDRLNPGALGPYGNTWLETAAFNQLAGESLLLETALADAVDLPTIYRSYWQGIPAWQSANEAQTSTTLPDAARQTGCRCVLITDDQQVAEHALAERWEEIILLPAADAVAQPTADQTSFARLFQEACGWIAQAEGPFLLWLHARGMSGPWDAPYALRAQLADLDDPDPPDCIEPPEQWLPEDADPDIALGYTQAYSGQVLALDECLDALLQMLREMPAADDALWCVTAPRAYPLGEHRQIGPGEQLCYAELLQIPLLLRFPDRLAAATRSQELAQPFDLFPALAEWMHRGANETDEPAAHLLRLAVGVESPRRKAATVGPQQQTFRTPAWFLRRSNLLLESSSEPQLEIFSKPDDRWEVHEVGDRCADTMAAMNDELDALLAQSKGLQDELPPDLA